LHRTAGRESGYGDSAERVVAVSIKWEGERVEAKDTLVRFREALRARRQF
jgi:hypothetical protein